MSRKLFLASSGRGYLAVSLTDNEASALLAMKERFACHSMADLVRKMAREWGALACADLIGGDTFIERRIGNRQKWPTFHQDVRAWVDGAPLDQFLRQGVSKNGLYVRFRIYAQEQGWIESSQRIGRDHKARRQLAAWLATDEPTPRSREIAKIFLESRNGIEAARKAGVSRQRIGQVIHAARRGVEMAERVEGFPRKVKLSQKISQAWFDGAVWKLTEDVDFHGDPGVFIGSLRAYANTRGYKVRSQRDLSDARVLYVQLVRREAAESTKEQAS